MSRISFNSSIESMSTQEIRAVRDEFSRLQREHEAFLINIGWDER